MVPVIAPRTDALPAALVKVVYWRFVLNHQGWHHDVHPLQVAAIDAVAR